jgi:hypothetical protein
VGELPNRKEEKELNGPKDLIEPKEPGVLKDLNGVSERSVNLLRNERAVQESLMEQEKARAKTAGTGPLPTINHPPVQNRPAAARVRQMQSSRMRSD